MSEQEETVTPADALPVATEPPHDQPPHEEAPEPRADIKAEASQDKPATPPAPPAAMPAPRRADGLARSLVVMLWLLLFGAAGAAWYFGLPELTARDARLDALEAKLAQVEGDTTAVLTGFEDEARAMVTTVMNPLEQRLSSLSQQLSSDAAVQRNRISESQQTLNDQMRRFDQRFVRIDERLSRLTATDRRAWLVQEAAFLVRLGGQRLAAARDVESAAALLQTADDLLLEANDPLLDGARRALAADVVTLKSVIATDVVGIDARLDALIMQSAGLTLIQPEPELPPIDQGTWLERAEAGWQAALAKLSDYLVIRQRSADFSSLLTPDWETLARQNLRMLLEQAQIALLSGNQVLFERALSRGKEFALLFESSDPARVAIVAEEIDALAALSVAPELPDLLASRRALTEAIRQLEAESGD